MYNVYLETFGTVWEPAEGGYDVEVSSVELVGTVSSSSDWRQWLREEFDFSRSYFLSNVRKNEEYWAATDKCDSDGYPILELHHAPWSIEMHRSFGCGWTVYLLRPDQPAPCGKSYLGYR